MSAVSTILWDRMMSTDLSPYFRPRCPSKLDGRRGTRREWKRANPPGKYIVTTRKKRLPDGRWVEF